MPSGRFGRFLRGDRMYSENTWLWEGEAPAEPKRFRNRRLGRSLALPKGHMRSHCPHPTLPREYPREGEEGRLRCLGLYRAGRPLRTCGIWGRGHNGAELEGYGSRNR